MEAIHERPIDKTTAKVIFDLEEASWHGYATESLWARQVAFDRFQLLNSPFFVFGVSFMDIIDAKNVMDRIFKFGGISESFGHSTYRVITAEDVDFEEAGKFWEQLREHGCSWELGPGRLRSVDVPPVAPIYDVYKIFEEAEALGIWDFEEGHCGHPM